MAFREHSDESYLILGSFNSLEIWKHLELSREISPFFSINFFFNFFLCILQSKKIVRTLTLYTIKKTKIVGDLYTHRAHAHTQTHKAS